MAFSREDDKTRSAGDDVAPDISLRRRFSHANQENPQTLAPPIYSGTVSPDLYFGMGQMREFFLPSSLKFAPKGDRTQDLRGAAGSVDQ
jgi:hypothetical protein